LEKILNYNQTVPCSDFRNSLLDRGQQGHGQWLVVPPVEQLGDLHFHFTRSATYATAAVVMVVVGKPIIVGLVVQVVAFGLSVE